ncbi:MAG: hypothetical protein P8Q95_05745 [Candidatus Poseidoniaceae archaeon]|nr:hypothetical protein [Candidatus Poseidoniaceae archaeon]
MSGERVDVLRLGYRRGRDPRITTHLALVGRALGADRFLLAGDEDQDMFDNLKSVEQRFGKGLDCEHLKSPMGWLRKFVEEDAGDGLPGVAVHLTMYGEPFREAIPKIRRDRPLVVIVGGAKVPGEVFKLSQYNVAVGNQPHSEVAALGLFLDSWYGGNTIDRKFEDARLIIEPSANGKKVIDLDK